MSVFDQGEFANEKTVVIEVKADSPNTRARPTINGKAIYIENNVPTRVPQAYADVLIEAGYHVIVLSGSDAKGASDPVGGDGEGADAGDRTHGPGVSDTTGTVNPVSPTQLASMEAAAKVQSGETEAPRGEAASTFDAEAAIEGNVGDVVDRLSDMSLAQLEAVDTAEADREKPRTGVRAAVAAAIAELNETEKKKVN